MSAHGRWGGTAAGYKRHNRAHEEPCQACLEAHRARLNPEQKPSSRPPGTPDWRKMVADSLAEGLIDPEDADILLRRLPW